MDNNKQFMPMAPMMSQIIQNALPAQVPDMEFESGFISDIFYNMKLGRMEKAQKRRTVIEIHKNKAYEAQIKTVKSFSLLPYELKNAVQETEHREKMRESERLVAEQNYRKAQMENQLLYYQVEQERITFETAQKNFKQMFPEEEPNE